MKRNQFTSHKLLLQHPRSVYIDLYLKRLYFYVTFLVISLVAYFLITRLSVYYGISTILLVILQLVFEFIAIAISYTLTHRGVRMLPHSDKYVTEAEASSIIRASRSGLWGYAQSGKVRSRKEHGRSVYSYVDLMRIQEEQTYKSPIDIPMEWMKNIARFTVSSLLIVLIVISVIIGYLFSQGNFSNTRPSRQPAGAFYNSNSTYVVEESLIEGKYTLDHI